jgi:hypothetical protein
VDFAEALTALEALESEGVVVDASVWGSDEDSDSLASLRGVLRRFRSDDEPSAAMGEEAVVFAVGDGVSHVFTLWPSRFIDASQDEINGVRIRTRDGRLTIRRNQAWID